MKRLSREESRQLTREALLDAAARVIVRRGFQASSIEEICAEAGYTRGAFYSNFKTKQQLFAEVLHDRFLDLYTAIYEDALSQPEQPLSLRKLGEIIAAVQTRPENRLLQLEGIAQTGRDEELREVAASFWRGNRAMGAEVIRRHAPDFTDEAKAISTAMIALDIGLAIQHSVDPEEAPLEIYPELYVLLFGFLTQARRTAELETGAEALGASS